MADIGNNSVDEEIENSSQKLSQLDLKRLLTDSDSSDDELIHKKRKENDLILIDQINENSEGDCFTALIVFKGTIHKFPNGKTVFSLIVKDNDSFIILSFNNLDSYKELKLSGSYTFTIGKICKLKEFNKTLLKKHSSEFNNYEVIDPEFIINADINIIKLNLNFCSIRSLIKQQNDVDVDLFVIITSIEKKIELKDKKMDIQIIKVIDKKKIQIDVTLFNDMIVHFEEMKLSIGDCIIIIKGATSDYNSILGIKMAPYSQLVKAEDFRQLEPKIKKYEGFDLDNNIELKDYILKNIKKEKKIAK